MEAGRNTRKNYKVKDKPDICAECGKRMKRESGLISMMKDSYCWDCIEKWEFDLWSKKYDC